MLLVAPVLDAHRVPVTDEQRETMRNDPDLRNPRQHSSLQHSGGYPSTTARGCRLWTPDVIRAWPRCCAGSSRGPVVRSVNTSFNVRGDDRVHA